MVVNKPNNIVKPEKEYEYTLGFIVLFVFLVFAVSFFMTQ